MRLGLMAHFKFSKFKVFILKSAFLLASFFLFFILQLVLKKDIYECLGVDGIALLIIIVIYQANKNKYIICNRKVYKKGEVMYCVSIIALYIAYCILLVQSLI